MDAEEEERTKWTETTAVALALGLKSSEGFLLARHLTKQLEVNPFLRPSILFLRIYVPKLRRFLNYWQCFGVSSVPSILD